MCLALCVLTSAAQVKKYYCEVKSVISVGSSLPSVSIDFGDSPVYASWKKLTGLCVLVDENGKWLSFNSLVDAANFMSSKGWTFVQAYTTEERSQNTVHWIFCKEANSPEEAVKGILTRREYKRMKKN